VTSVAVAEWLLYTAEVCSSNLFSSNILSNNFLPMDLKRKIAGVDQTLLRIFFVASCPTGRVGFEPMPLQRQEGEFTDKSATFGHK